MGKDDKAGSGFDQTVAQLKERIRRLEAMERAQLAISMEPEPSGILRVLAEAAVEALGAETVAVPVLSDDEREVRYDCAVGRHASAFLGKALPIGESGLCGWVLQNKKPILSVELLEDPRVLKELAGSLGIHTAVLVPLIARGRIIGGLSAFNKADGSKFDPDDLTLLTQLAGYAALAVSSAALLRDVRREKLKAEAVLDRMADGIVVISADGVFTDVNEAACGCLMVDCEALVGTNVKDLPAEGALGRLFDWAAPAAPGGRCWEQNGCVNSACPAYGADFIRCWSYSEGHCRVPEYEGREGGVKLWDVCSHCDAAGKAYAGLANPREHEFYGRTLQVTSTLVIEDDGNNIFGEVVVLHDITGERRLVKERADFVSMLTHDMKTPITSILGYCDLIGMEADAGPVREMAGGVEDNARRLNRMVNEFLEFSRMEAGSFRPAPIPMRLGSFFGVVAGQYGQAAREAGVEFGWEVADATPEAYADADLMARVVGNLVTNAVKFAGAGSHVRLSASPGPKGFVELAVSDDGPGIDPEDLPRIFDKYYKGRRTKADGSGLGLAIVKLLVEAQGGKVTAQSGPGKGATFRVLLPAAQG